MSCLALRQHFFWLFFQLILYNPLCKHMLNPARLGEADLCVSTNHLVYTEKKINKNKLTLLPMGTLQLLPVDKIQPGHCIVRCTALTGQVFLVQGFKCDFVKESGLFCPYWMIKEGSSMEDSMLARQILKHGNLSIPTFINKKQLEKHTLLEVEPVEDTSGTQKKRRKTS